MYQTQMKKKAKNDKPKNDKPKMTARNDSQKRKDPSNW
jgi:hypothetical protein